MRTESGQQRTTARSRSGLIGRAAEHVQQFLCGLHGHDALLHFEQGRISLQCTSCGYQTPGWEVKKAPPRAHDPQPARQTIRLPLVGERRVA